MQLNYRGVSFTKLVAGTPTVETGQTGTFLGKRYAMKETQVAFRQGTEDLTYRGVRYSR